jgi:hypothetical protein
MTADRSARRPARRRLATALLVALPLVLAVIAEAAWISVIAGLVQDFALRQPSLGIAPLAGFVVVGVVAARFIGPRLGERWPLAAAGICLAAGAVGWLSTAEARAVLGSGGPVAALAAHPAGWLAAIAVARGFAHARLPLSEATLGHLLGAGVPTLAVAAMAGGMIAEPFRGLFLADAIIASIIFVTAATLALALTRLTAVGADSGFDWRRNPWWVGLLTILVLVTTALASAVSSIAAPAIAFAVGAAIGPLLILALVVGFNRGTIRILVLAAIAAVAFAGLMNLIGGRAIPTVNLGGAAGSQTTPARPEEVVVVGSGLLLVIAAIAIILLARLWMRRTPAIDTDVLETRTIDRSGTASRPNLRRPRRRPEPVDAVTAYVALVEDLGGRAQVAREPAETPAEHARRLRTAGAAGLGLDLLAADYELVRFAGVRLSAAEDRRAVARWRSLRRQIVRGRR